MAYTKREYDVYFGKQKFNYKDFKTGTEHKLYDELLNLKASKKLNLTLDAVRAFVELRAKKEILTTSQLRNLYAEVLKIKEVSGLQLFRPRLAYIAGRNRNARDIVLFFDNLASDVKNDSQLENYKAFMEAVVSYHKFFHE